MSRRRLRFRSILPTLLALCIVAAGASVVWLRAAPQIAAAQSSPEPIPAPPAAMRNTVASPHFIGSGSCAARACHGSPALSPGREWNSAYAVWSARDPHPQAYSVLFTPESKRMAAALGLADASKAERCLACHASPVADNRAGAALNDAASVLSDGVGCEACHGAAENYLAAHTMRGWEQLGAARFEPKFGMKNTGDVAARAQICAGCHVGQGDAQGRPWRDVNHDLIAAGHPRLNFEFSAYMAALPPHWNTQKDRKRFDELRSWVIGQWVTCQSAQQLLECRANAAKSADSKDLSRSSLAGASWPELSEYDCYACHHGLSGKSWRQDVNAAAAKTPSDATRNEGALGQTRPPRKSGAAAWGTWYFEAPRLLANTEAIVPQAQATQFLDVLNSLTQTMQTPLPDAHRVALDAAAIGTDLSKLSQRVIEHLPSQANSTEAAALRRALINSLAAQFDKHRPESWDAFVQYYLALVALHRSEIDSAKSPSAAGGARNKQAAAVLEEIRNRLSFPADTSAPAGGLPSPNLRVLRSGVNSPEQFDPYMKPVGAVPSELAGKNLFELFDDAFRSLSGAGSTS